MPLVHVQLGLDFCVELFRIVWNLVHCFFHLVEPFHVAAVSLDPVSYTHLDVYKRQVWHNSLFLLPVAWIIGTIMTYYIVMRTLLESFTNSRLQSQLSVMDL